MPRPRCQRWIGFVPAATYFKPAGVPLRALEEVIVTLDESEALRLADLEGRYQEEAAESMKISRPTFARIIESARRKVADALVNGKALRIEGGPVASISPAGPVFPPCRQRGRGWGCGRRRGWGSDTGETVVNSNGAAKNRPT